jgi:hypothetical protein
LSFFWAGAEIETDAFVVLVCSYDFLDLASAFISRSSWPYMFLLLHSCGRDPIIHKTK